MGTVRGAGRWAGLGGAGRAGEIGAAEGDLSKPGNWKFALSLRGRGWQKGAAKGALCGARLTAWTERRECASYILPVPLPSLPLTPQSGCHS